MSDPRTIPIHELPTEALIAHNPTQQETSREASVSPVSSKEAVRATWLDRLVKWWQGSEPAWPNEEGEEERQQKVNELDAEFRLAAYKERNANFRHFDTLRWQVPGLGLVVGGALLTFAPRSNGQLPHPAILAIYGVFAVLCARLMYRVGVNLRANNAVLRRYAKSFGDESIPPPPLWRGASRYVEIFLAAVGVLSIIAGGGSYLGLW